MFVRIVCTLGVSDVRFGMVFGILRGCLRTCRGLSTNFGFVVLGGSGSSFLVLNKNITGVSQELYILLKNKTTSKVCIQVFKV